MMKTSKLAFACALGLMLGATTAPAFAADSNGGAMRPGAPMSKGQPGPGKPQGCEFEHHHHMMGGYGHGMMGGHGMAGGHGMMGGFGGMMMESPSMHLVRSLKLSDEQRSKINKLSDQLRHDNWATMGSMMDETDKLRDLYEADRRDPDAIGKEYQKIFDLKRKMIVDMIKTQNKVEDQLTSKQRAQLKDMRKKMRSMYGY